MLKVLLCLGLLLYGGNAFNHGADLENFRNYKATFGKSYANPTEENNANYYFNYHTKLINQHNLQADRKQNSYRVRINQFSDIRLITFAARLPKAVYPEGSFNTTPVAVEEIATEPFDILTEYGMDIAAQDQGTLCSSSWAYAVAKSIQILNALPATPQPMNNSAQHLIDCAGMGTACTTQVPQMAFDYLTQNPNTELLTEAEYQSHENGLQGMCTPPLMSTTAIKLASYATIPDNDDETLKRYVSSSIPVIVEYNPATFGFMHYSSGVYVPPTRATASSSQFLVVVGYGHDAESNLDYWRCLNSFGDTWGDNGYINIVRSATQPIAKGAIFPNSLA